LCRSLRAGTTTCDSSQWAEREEETPNISRETQGFSIPASQITSQSHTKGCRDALRRIAAVSQIPRRTGALHNDREADGGRARAIERRRRGPSSATPTSARRSHSAQSSASRLRVMGQVRPRLTAGERRRRWVVLRHPAEAADTAAPVRVFARFKQPLGALDHRPKATAVYSERRTEHPQRTDAAPTSPGPRERSPLTAS